MSFSNPATTTNIIRTNSDQQQTQSTIFTPHEIRSPLAATRANSLASAASPTGSACLKSIPQSATDSPKHKHSEMDFIP